MPKHRDGRISQQVGPVLITGYLEQDEDCESPFDSTEGIGELKLFERGLQNINNDIWEKYRGDPLAVALEVYDHGGRTYALRDDDNFPDNRWDVAFCGYLVPDEYWLSDYKGKLKELGSEGAMTWHKEQARSILETYNQWVGGDCWGYVVEIDSVEHDSCWGFIGLGCAQDALESAFADAIEHTKKSNIEKAQWRELHVTG